jgi:phenylpropionate dioxygenase-like ring-hydroxylating dioxygenase large terminal subunit
VELARAETLPAAWYHEPSVYARERERLFAREWLLFGHESQLPRPGDALAESVAGWPLFLVRGSDGAVRGFHNVCRHRAGPLVWDGAEHCKVLRCKYHGWVYELDGRLRSAPDFGDAEGFDPAQLALEPVRVAAWRGLLFVNLGPGAPPLEEALAPFARAAAQVPLEAAKLCGAARHELACNWKTYVENYLEGYHVPYLHPSLHREIDVKGYRVEVGDGFALHFAPPRPSVREPVYEGFWAWLAPNAAINVYASGMSLERMLPTGPGTMRIEYLFFFRDTGETGAAEREAALAMCAQVTEEDRRICEAVQRNLRAGIYRSGRLSPRHENGVFAFQQRVRAALGEGA